MAEANENTGKLAESLVDHLQLHEEGVEYPHGHARDFDTFKDKLELTEQQIEQLVELADGKASKWF